MVTDSQNRSGARRSDQNSSHRSERDPSPGLPRRVGRKQNSRRQQTREAHTIERSNLFHSATKLFEALSRPAQAVYGSSSLDQANDALHAIGIKTELDSEREYYQTQKALADLMFKELHRDVAVLMASRGVRAFAFSYLNVIFAIYLTQLGYSTITVGLVISTAYASGAVLTACGVIFRTASAAKRFSSCSPR